MLFCLVSDASLRVCSKQALPSLFRHLHVHQRTCQDVSVLRRPAVRCNVTKDKPFLRYVGASGVATDGICYQKALWGAVDSRKLEAPLITNPDEYFERDHLQFVFGTNELALEDLISLFQKVGFPRRNADQLSKALNASHKVLWIRHTKRTRFARLGQLLGFARATSDHVVAATIWDVAVHPAWQRSGLGRGLVERLVAALVDDGVNAVTLYAEPHVVRMYEKLGFLQDPTMVQGLSFQRSSPAGAALVASCNV